MSEAPRIAIVGVGSIGSRHIDNLLAMGYQDLVGIDPRPMPHETRLPIVQSFEGVNYGGITHVVICSPPELHYKHASYFLEQGIPTFVEKPLAVNSHHANELLWAAAEHNTYIAVGYMERAHPVVKQANEFIEEHGCIKAEICCYWMATQKTYNLAIAQESSHAIDLAIFLLGPALLKASHKEGNEVTIRTDFDGGATCVIRMNMHEWPRRVLNLRGRDGEQFREMYGETQEEWDACYKAELQAFLDGKPLCTGEAGLRVVEILEEMR